MALEGWDDFAKRQNHSLERTGLCVPETREVPHVEIYGVSSTSDGGWQEQAEIRHDAESVKSRCGFVMP